MTGPNFVPERYRGVAVATVPPDVALTADALRKHLLGRDAYRKTRFVVARHPPPDLTNGTLVQLCRTRVPFVRTGGVAVVRVTRASADSLFSPITAVELIAGPDECAYVVDPDVDTGVPSALAAAALDRAPHARVVVVEGRYAHVNFIVEPRPLRIVVRDVAPPEPAKLLDQARRMLAVAEELPPVELVDDVVELGELAARTPAEHYLLPCRGSGAVVAGARVSYLDEHPERADWTLLGCARSRQIHRHFYGDEPPSVDLCPRADPPPGPVLTKCCLQEEHLEEGDGWVSVPWGSSLRVVGEALARLAAKGDPAWRPA